MIKTNKETNEKIIKTEMTLADIFNPDVIFPGLSGLTEEQKDKILNPHKYRKIKSNRLINVNQ